MKIYLFGVLLLVAVAQQVRSQECHFRELDLCTAIGLFHFERNGIPPDDEHMNAWCEAMNEVTQCVGNFTNKCMSPMQKEIMGLLAGSEEVVNQLCVPGSEVRINYLAHAECLAHSAKGEEFKIQLRDLQAVFEKLFEVPFENRFNLLCCGFERFHKTVEEMNAEDCGEHAVEMIHNLMKMMVLSNVPDIVCEQFDHEGEECKALLPPSGTMPKEGKGRTQLGKTIDTILNNL